MVLTTSATHFLNGQSQEQPTIESLAALPNVDGIYQDKDELGESWVRGAGILHINLRKWAHILVIAPLSANTLAKIVNGMSDNLLTDTIRAWDTSGQLDGMKKRIVVFPAMNVAMWLHPVTTQQIRVLEEDWGVRDEVDGTGSEDGWFEVLRPIGVCDLGFPVSLLGSLADFNYRKCLHAEILELAGCGNGLKSSPLLKRDWHSLPEAIWYAL